MVFDFISSAANDFEWQYGTLASGPTKPESTRTGGSFRTIGHLMGRRMQSTYEVTHLEADRRYGFKSISGPLHLHTMYTLETEKGRTRVQVTTQANPANVLQTSERVVERFMQKQLREDLALLKSILEARSSLPGRAD
jgi:hypothetical protein